jgi:arginine exporter protein ArgO
MQNDNALTREHLKTPKAAAIAGIVFSILLALMFWLFRSSVPADPLERGEWIATSAATAALGLNLVPFAGIDFLWFIGVLRDRLGSMEDRFFATAFFGSALLFLAMLFIAAAVAGAVILVASTMRPDELINSATFKLARAAAYIIANVYAIKMAGHCCPVDGDVGCGNG